MAKKINEVLFQTGVVPVIRLENPERDAAPLARALCEGGIPLAEVTFRAARAERTIQIMKETCPEMTVGAGTVVYTSQVDISVQAGAEFLVSPGFDPELVDYCLSQRLSYYPGVMTATEYQMAARYRLDVLKFFPAESAGGVARIEEMADPFPMFQILPTGKIPIEKLGDYIRCRHVIACGVSYLSDPVLIEEGRWDEITELARRSREIVIRA
ncbi:MAG: bifunctional 4-hydroxy-2-oxoglutarate aldolase/2-dehydro-3-deoxy-phosphogluconate aldolase, partial [Lachnospiraceae bacterium]|nr:bifunctional 4-hydroxy-2-oxoglutarate aldolase/2-dehydro-3-deoxy-phosphogluconate aldolase [Lachnospiraceae bacterium]